jgi:hypothetical protein
MRLISCVLVVAVLGCSTNYIPRRPGTVAVTMRDGKLVYTRDGQAFEHGILGGGLVDAVQGNPAAMIAANEYHGRIKSGVIAALLGSAAMIGGLTYGIANAANEPDGTTNNRAVGTSLLVALGGIVLALGGAMYAASAEPYRWDAINIYNDGAQAPMTAPPGWSATAAPKQTLKMRD